MDHFTNIEKRCGVGIGRGDGLHPPDGKWRVGKEGFDKNILFYITGLLDYIMDYFQIKSD